MKWLIFWFVAYFVGNTDSQQQQWVDPYDMTYNTQNEANLRSRIATKKEYYCEEKCEKNDCITDIYLKRLINYLIAHLNTDTYSDHLNIHLNKAEYDFLLDFVKTKDSRVDSLRKLDAILSSALKKTYYERASSLLSPIKQQLYETLFSTPVYLMIIAVIVFYKMLQAQFSLKTIVKYLLIYAYLIDFIMTYQHLIKEAELKQMIDVKTYGTVPPDCNVHNMSFIAYIKFQWKSKFGESDCANYHKAIHQNVLYLVTPMRVFTHQFGVFIVQPCKHLGSAIGEFINGLGDALPWYFKLLILPLILVICGLICILSANLTKTCVRIKLFHLFSLEFGQRQNQQIETVRIVQQPIMGNAEHREYIENIDLSPQSSDTDRNSSIAQKSESTVTEEEDSKLGNSSAITDDSINTSNNSEVTSDGTQGTEQSSNDTSNDYEDLK